jgi:hypothetical protein
MYLLVYLVRRKNHLAGSHGMCLLEYMSSFVPSHRLLRLS